MFPGELIPLTVPEVRRLLCRLLWLPRGSPTLTHPMVRLETAPPGPCHAVSLQETLSGTFTACATVILMSAVPCVFAARPGLGSPGRYRPVSRRV